MHSSDDQVRWKWDATQTRWTMLLKMQTFISQGRTPAPATDTFCHNQGYMYMWSAHVCTLQLQHYRRMTAGSILAVMCGPVIIRR